MKVNSCSNRFYSLGWGGGGVGWSYINFLHLNSFDSHADLCLFRLRPVSCVGFLFFLLVFIFYYFPLSVVYPAMLFVFLFFCQPHLPFPVNTSLWTSNYWQVVTQWFHSERCHSARASNSYSNYILRCLQSCLSAKCCFQTFPGPAPNLIPGT